MVRAEAPSTTARAASLQRWAWFRAKLRSTVNASPMLIPLSPDRTGDNRGVLDRPSGILN
jgi:hypothetical protein